jgi:hypothetical protein
MPWQLQPLIWPLLIATLALLAIPRNAHPQSADLINACRDDAIRLCESQVRALGKTTASDKPEVVAARRKAIGACMQLRVKHGDTSAACSETIKREFPEIWSNP